MLQLACWTSIHKDETSSESPFSKRSPQISRSALPRLEVSEQDTAAWELLVCPTFSWTDRRGQMLL